MEKESLNLKEIQQASLKILCKVADICEQQGFRYFLTYGTLIGAIRHEGFIPWDDDIDILMPREDYNKLIKYWEKHHYVIDDFRLFTPESNDKYPYYIARVSDDRYEMIAENEKSYGQGVFIDIYPYDGLGNDKQKADALCTKGELLSSFCFQASRKKYVLGYTEGWFRKIMKFPIFVWAKIMGVRHYQKKLADLGDLGSFDESEYVGCAVWNSCGGGIVQRREWFDEVIYVSFEGYKFRAPKEYHKILKLLYEDYMELPPKEKRIAHHFYDIYRK